MKKFLFTCCLLGIGVFLGVSGNAEAYVGDTDSVKIDSEANKKAIELLKASGELGDVRFPLDKLTTETPIQSEFISENLRVAPKNYRAYQWQYVNGMTQAYCKELAPVGFNWTDNGIPEVATYSHTGSIFSFKPGYVWDTGVGAYDSGYYWRKIGTSKGTFWASVWNLNNLIYG